MKKAVESLKEYILYVAKNIFQIWKSWINAKLDKDLQNVAKNHIIEIEMFHSKDINSDDREKNIEEKDKDNIDLPIADIYLYTITIMHMH